MPDFTCILAAVLIFTGNLLLAIWGGIERSRPTFAWDSYRKLDPTFLQEHWVDRNDLAGLHFAGSFIIAISWVILVIPFMQCAFLLSNGGQRQLWVHTMMCTLAISAATTEFVARLMHVGSWNTGNWISKDFYLDDWGGNEQSPNGVGWKSLEVSYQLASGTILWVDGWEYFALFGILILNFWSIRTSRVGLLGDEMCWAGMGFFIGCLSLADFVFLILRFKNWDTFNMVSIMMTVLIRLILLPIWLILLSCKLPAAVEDFNQRRAEAAATNGVMSPKNPISPTGPGPNDFTISD